MKHLNKARDKAIFRHSAERTRSINLSPRVSRGGIRL